MEFDDESLTKLMQLCRIHFPEGERDRLKDNLSRVLAYMLQLGDLDTSDVPPCNFVISDKQLVLREDDAIEHMSREDFLANAPDQVAGMVRVPPVMKS